MSGGIRFTFLLALVATAVVVAAASANARPEAARSLTARNDLESAVLAHINALRRAHGLAPLRANARLRAAADSHSSSMIRRGFFSHTSADGTPFSARIARYYPRGRAGYRAIGENLLWSSPDVDAGRALSMWLNSLPHRRNLLRTHWREIGLSAFHANAAPGVYRNAPVTVLTANFGVRR
jgi:uncharacterized protein YkwD